MPSSTPPAVRTSIDRRRAVRRLFLAAACFLALAVAGAAPARAQTELLAGYPAQEYQPKGPAAAAGAVIWSHGLERVAESDPFLPFVADYVRDKGYDVFILKRRWAAEDPRQSSEALAKAVAELKGQGYRQVVLMGQSFGAWISFGAAVLSPDIDAVVAFAPAAFGPAKQPDQPQPNAVRLYPIIEKLRARRVMVFLFDRDQFDPGGRGEAIAKILDARAIPHLIVDRPDGLEGHGVAVSSGFAHRFGRCVAAFLTLAAVPPGFTCDQVPASAQIAFTLPKGLKVVRPPANASPGLAAFSGRWYGHYNNGREVLLVVEEMGVDRVLAVYAWARSTRLERDRNGYERRRGEYDSGSATLSFTEPGKRPLTFRLRPDGRLEGTWTAPNDRYTLTGTLRRVSQQ